MAPFLSSTVRRIPLLRWLWAIAVSVMACVRAIPTNFRYVNHRLTSLKDWPTWEANRVRAAAVKRWRRRLRNLTQHRLSTLGALPNHMRHNYVSALGELQRRGDAVGKARLAKLKATARAKVHELKLADARAQADKLGAERDRAALASDWKAVGDDLRAAMPREALRAA